jgi:hypothetical protein
MHERLTDREQLKKPERFDPSAKAPVRPAGSALEGAS